jgi:hypothetical protein
MSDAASALLYLRYMSMRNAFVLRITRLKQPKYLVGGIVGVAYIYYFFVRRMMMSRRPNGNPWAQGFAPEWIGTIIAIAALILLIIFILCWVWPRERASLAFSEPEIAFLFPAPVSRTTLIHYRLLTSQFRTLFTSLIFTFASSGWSFLHGGIFIRVLGWHIVFVTLSLHIIGSGFVLTRLLEGGWSPFRRQLLVYTVIAAIVAVAGLLVWRDWQAPSAADLANGDAIAKYIGGVLNSGAIAVMLWPFKLLVRPLFAADWHAFALAAWPALLVYVVHYAWVLYVQTIFEEASVLRAEKAAARLAARRQGRRGSTALQKARKPRFTLAAAGRPEIAFLWKNLFGAPDYLSPRTALTIALIIVVGGVWLTRHPDYLALQIAIGVSCSFMAAWWLVFGPIMARQDLRSDLLNADILKTYPLKGWQIVLGEIMTPVMVVSMVFWLFLLVVAFCVQTPRLPDITPLQRFGAAFGIALLAPPLVALEVLVMNAAALLFPAWVQLGAQRTQGGIDVMGQRLMFLAALLVVIVVGLIPATLSAALVFWVAQLLLSIPLAIAFGVVAALAVLLAEIAIGVAWLGGHFERFDLSNELRT